MMGIEKSATNDKEDEYQRSTSQKPHEYADFTLASQSGRGNKETLAKTSTLDGSEPKLLEGVLRPRRSSVGSPLKEND